jgi:hypothetical protein
MTFDTTAPPGVPAKLHSEAPFDAPYLRATADLGGTLSDKGFVVLDATQVASALVCPPDALSNLNSTWNDLPPDLYLKDGGRYRRRRHSCFLVDGDAVTLAPHRAHWQPVEYNALHGGMQRWFEPISDAVVVSPVWSLMLVWLADIASEVSGRRPWFVEAHQFRIDTTDGIGRPTPEGAHRDGVDFVAVFLVDRQAIKGGETRVFDARGPAGQRFTLFQPWSLLLLDDARVIHESTPIQPVGDHGHRDTLVVTLRKGGFQGA